jgi:hypothetical protein
MMYAEASIYIRVDKFIEDLANTVLDDTKKPLDLWAPYRLVSIRPYRGEIKRHLKEVLGV